MTACCCRLTQPETSRSRKAIGRGHKSIAEACRSGATRFKVRRLISWRSETISGTSLPAEYPHSTGYPVSLGTTVELYRPKGDRELETYLCVSPTGNAPRPRHERSTAAATMPFIRLALPMLSLPETRSASWRIPSMVCRQGRRHRLRTRTARGTIFVHDGGTAWAHKVRDYARDSQADQSRRE
jgi:hypothetical protein